MSDWIKLLLVIIFVLILYALISYQVGKDKK